MKKAEASVKIEDAQIRLDSIPRSSTIAQFIKSGQAAFGSIDPQILQGCNETSGGMQKWMLDRVHEQLAAASDLYHDDILILRSLLKLEYSADTTGYQHLRSELSRLMISNLTYAAAFTKSVSDASLNEVPRRFKDEVLRDVARDLGDICIDMRNYETIEGQVAVHLRNKDGESPKPCPLEKLSAAQLGDFTKQFYGSGLYKPVESMLANLRSAMDQALTMDLHTLYVPFLQELIGLMLMYGIPLTNAIYSAFFESVLLNYLQRFVGQEPAQRSSAEHDLWAPRAAAARGRLEAFDHSYFREILGEHFTTST
ncbi:hypothetical protein E8E12_011722 [Didymella heteroderae]|uniref:Uncharacterized protein n=1 Tax=Didymella heteroderae TaxID=1769908 RepID=A0A9P4X0P8_9PLEO|nr:hypothetical protein E8E12_011722 [Didymella heteroderae]